MMITAFTTATRLKANRKPQERTKLTLAPTVSRGDKLLCIDDYNFCRSYTPGPPLKGHVYFVREVYEDSGQTGVLLVGIRGPIQPNGLEQGFFLSRFLWVHD